MANSLETEIDIFLEHYQKTFPHLVTAFDEDWPSPCELGHPTVAEDSAADSAAGGKPGIKTVRWRPVARAPDSAAADFAGLENALQMTIHPDIKTHYGRYWSANLEAEAPDGHVSLLYLWNPQDVERLRENLVGHAVACKHNRTPFSVFFACTEPDSELFLTVNNSTGEVQVEEPGKKPIGTVCGSLAEFYSLLVPAAAAPLTREEEVIR